jgi:hypothetical protein
VNRNKNHGEQGTNEYVSSFCPSLPSCPLLLPLGGFGTDWNNGWIIVDDASLGCDLGWFDAWVYTMIE